MGGMKFEYDENGAKFVYFLLSFYAMVIIPCTYYFWPRKDKKKDQHSEDLSCFEPCRLKNQLLNQHEPRKRFTQKIVKIVLIIGWVIFLVLAYQASKIEIEHKEYDPFIILGIDKGASIKEIKKKYYELSKVMHPDKGGDENKFKEVAKAYQALTDEETRNNWEKYGNPDGPGVTQFGIALPKWIVDGKNSYLVLGAYVLVFMVLMPTIVGVWWYKSIKYTGDQVLIKTYQMYYYIIIRSSQIIIKRAIMILGSSFEFERSSNPEVIERPSDNVEMPQLMKDLPDLQEKIRELPYSNMYSIKARALIHAHLSRLPLPENTLLKDKNVVVKKCPFLINEMVNVVSNIIAAVNANAVPRGIRAPRIDTIENIMRLSPMIVQALWDKNKKLALLQLPHINESHLRHFVTKKRNICTIKQFVTMKDTDRRSILRHLTDEQYDDIMRVCCSYPLIDMEVKTKVFDDEDEQLITVGAIVTVVVNLKRQSLEALFGKEDTAPTGLLDNPNENEYDDEENNAEENEKQTQKQNSKYADNKKKKSKFQKPKSKPKPKPASKTVKASESVNNNNEKKKQNDDADQEDNDGNQNDNYDDEEELDENNSGYENEENGDDEYRDKLLPKKSSKSEGSKNSKANSKQASKNSSENLEPSQNGDEYFEKFQQMQKKREKLETKMKISHRVYCPFFPDIKQECWWLYIGDRKQREIITAPVYICTLKDTEEIEIKFLAPKTQGTYSYSVILKSDSYLDFDVEQKIKFDVHPAKKVDEHPQWNFTDDEEAKNKEDDNDDEFTTESETND